MSDSEVQEKKARGRPRKSDAEKTASPAAKKPKASNDTPKRGRGRPKGSMNKKKKAALKKAASAGGKKRGRKPKAAKPAPEEEEEEEEAADEGAE